MKRIFYFSTIVIVSALLGGCAVEERSVTAEMVRQLALLPGDAQIIGYTNFDRIKDSEFFQMFIDSSDFDWQKNQEYQDFIAGTGLDLQRDIHELYIAVHSADNTTNRAGLLIIKGQFDPQKIMDYVHTQAQSAGYAESSYRDKTIYTMDNHTKAFCFYDENTFVAGEADAVKGWLDRSMEKKQALNDQILERIGHLKYKHSAWFMVNREAFLENLNTAPIKRIEGLEALQYIAVSMDMDNAFKLHSQSQFTSAEKAELFRDALKGVIAAGKLSLSEDRWLVDVLNAIKVDQKKNRIDIDWQLSKKELDKLRRKKDFPAARII